MMNPFDKGIERTHGWKNVHRTGEERVVMPNLILTIQFFLIHWWHLFLLHPHSPRGSKTAKHNYRQLKTKKAKRTLMAHDCACIAPFLSPRYRRFEGLCVQRDIFYAFILPNSLLRITSTCRKRRLLQITLSLIRDKKNYRCWLSPPFKRSRRREGVSHFAATNHISNPPLPPSKKHESSHPSN